MMPFTFSIANGIFFGIGSCLVLYITSGDFLRTMGLIPSYNLCVCFFCFIISTAINYFHFIFLFFAFFFQTTLIFFCFFVAFFLLFFLEIFEIFQQKNIKHSKKTLNKYKIHETRTQKKKT